MKRYEPSTIRNVALVGHGGAGKTMIGEALLFASGVTNRLGRIEDGGTVLDFEPEEHDRQHTIAACTASFEWQGHKINLIDCPGYADHFGDVFPVLRVADACIFVVSAVDGVEVQTELAWELAEDLALPRLIVVNKMDRERASFERTMQQLTERFGAKPFPLHLPLGAEQDFRGAADLLRAQGFTYDGNDPKGSPGDIPAELKGRVEEAHVQLVEAAAEGDDAFIEKYLEQGDLEEGEIAAGLARAVAAGTTAPVLVASATNLIGIDLLAGSICSLVPSPVGRGEIIGTRPGSDEVVIRPTNGDAPVTAFVFKTVSDPFVGKISIFRVLTGTLRPDIHLQNTTQGEDERIGQLFHMQGKDHVNVSELVCGDIGAVAKLAHTHTGDTLSDPQDQLVLQRVAFPEAFYSIAIAPKAHGEEEKLTTAMLRLHEEDPVLSMVRNPETHQTVLSGLGEAHLHINLERLRRKFGVEVEELPLRIPYREAVTGRAEFESRYIKQSGGRGQYAVAHLRVEALPRGSGYEFVNDIHGGSIPTNFVPSVDKGVQHAMEEGVLAGYPVVDCRVTVFDGKYHSVDSSDMAFQMAGSMGFKEAAKLAGLTLLEPIADVRIEVPDSLLGDIMGDVNARHGRIMGTEPGRNGYQEVHAQVPMGEMARYAIDLRSITGGRARFSMAFSHYEEVPAHLLEKVIEQARQDKLQAVGH